MNKIRLDLALVQRKYASTREEARALIMAGKVRVGGMVVNKAGKLIPQDAEITVERTRRYASRGWFKLDSALKEFGADPRGRIVMDVGASSGGFTQCLLEHGASRVYAVDVGFGIIAEELRKDPRVVLLERTNIRYLSPDRLPEKPDMITIDVSFISLKLVLPKVYEILKPNGEVIALIKPQFEVGRFEVEKGGVIKDENKQRRVIEEITAFAREIGFSPLRVVESPIRGKDGNREFFIYLKKYS